MRKLRGSVLILTGALIAFLTPAFVEGILPGEKSERQQAVAFGKKMKENVPLEPGPAMRSGEKSGRVYSVRERAGNVRLEKKSLVEDGAVDEAKKNAMRDIVHYENQPIDNVKPRSVKQDVINYSEDRPEAAVKHAAKTGYRLEQVEQNSYNLREDARIVKRNEQTDVKVLN